jgi:hypothetical protein
VILWSPDRQGLSGNRTSIPRTGGEEESSRLTRDRDGRERGVAALPAGGGRRGARRAARPASPRPPSRLAGGSRFPVGESWRCYHSSLGNRRAGAGCRAFCYYTIVKDCHPWNTCPSSSVTASFANASFIAELSAY